MSSPAVLDQRIHVQAELLHAVGLQPKDCVKLGAAFSRVMAFSFINLQAKLRFLREEVRVYDALYVIVSMLSLDLACAPVPVPVLRQDTRQICRRSVLVLLCSHAALGESFPLALHQALPAVYAGLMYTSDHLILGMACHV